ncbi:hypothetical protein [Ferruginibacter profundus]
MKQAILHHWNFIRFIRLGMGIAIIFQAVAVKDVLFSIAGLLLTAMAVFNIGCCGAGGCHTAVQNSKEPVKEVGYEEVICDK